jgi:predicted kinase
MAVLRASEPGQLRRLAAGPCLVVLIGVPGSGKSTLARGTWSGERVLALDEFRGVVSGDECDQGSTPAALVALMEVLHARLQRRLTAVVDATNATDSDRRPLLAAARRYGLPAVAVVLATPLEQALARNAARPGPAPGARWGRRVPEAFIRARHECILACVPGLAAEGFQQVISWTA